ncbi:MAG: cwlD [Firmicutes bacterium]|nr:cwlD [Bacillota bacterium]
MRIISLRRRSLCLVTVIGVAAMAVFHLWTMNLVMMEEIETADMSVLAGKTIVIDPGHGGIDGGAQYNGLAEKNITLALALKLAQVIRENGASVVFTREGDIDYYTRGKGGKRNDLLKRIEIINNSGASLFVSIHTNAIRGKEWFGAEVYYHPKLEENKELAETIQQALKNFPPGNKRKSKKDLDILVLKNTNIPGVLVEAGFLSNPREADLLADDEYQLKLARYIAKALAYHFRRSVAR